MNKKLFVVKILKKATINENINAITKIIKTNLSLKLSTNGSKAQTIEGNKVKNKVLKSFFVNFRLILLLSLF